jgi:hypothetical protein
VFASEKTMRMKRLINHLFISFFGLLPARLARHLMFLLQSHPQIPDRWGVHIRSIHYYDPLPDFRGMTEAQAESRRTFPAIGFDLNAQMELQRSISQKARDELAELARTPAPAGYPFQNDYFGGLDAAVYYALIRHLKPAKVVEIGCGFSTRIADRALKANRAEGAAGRLICIEPFPQPRLTEALLDIELIEKPVQEVPLSLFQELKPNDILFIDSSHVAKFRSDVCYEFLEILPVLAPGVWVHVHDIFFPTDYPAQWLIERRIAFNEQYLLEAFLAHNVSFAPQGCLRWLWLDHAKEMRSLWPAGTLPRDDGNGAASFWMSRSSW